MTITTQSAGGVVVNPKGEVVVVNQQRASWSLPKGHVEGEETLLETARREIYEETGVSDLELVKELGTIERYKGGLNDDEDKSEWKIITMFLFRTNAEKLKPVDLENPEARWVPKKEVAGLLTYKEDKEFFSRIASDI